MGRTLLALLFLGLVAWVGHWAWGRWAVDPPPVEESAGQEGVQAALPGGSAPVFALRDPGTGPEGPTPPSTASAALRDLLGAGRAREAVARARTLTAEELRSPGTPAAAREAAERLAAEPGAGPADRLARADEARRLLGRLAVEDAVPLETVWERVQALNREVLFSGRELPGTLFRHTVKPGETLDRLLRRDWKGRVHVGFGLILHLNSIPSADRLRTVPISVPQEPVRILVRKKDYRLWVLLGEVPLRTYPVGLGTDGRTPEGRFVLEELMPRPDYWPPSGGKVAYGHPENPLGTRWLGFRDMPGAQGFGIHGTREPESIGRSMSQGCVRLLNADVEILFDWCIVGTEVEIRP